MSDQAPSSVTLVLNHEFRMSQIPLLFAGSQIPLLFAGRFPKGRHDIGWWRWPVSWLSLKDDVERMMASCVAPRCRDGAPSLCPAIGISDLGRVSGVQVGHSIGQLALDRDGDGLGPVHGDAGTGLSVRLVYGHRRRCLFVEAACSPCPLDLFLADALALLVQDVEENVMIACVFVGCQVVYADAAEGGSSRTARTGVDLGPVPGGVVLARVVQEKGVVVVDVNSHCSLPFPADRRTGLSLSP